MEPAGSRATWTGSPEGVFGETKHHKPRQSLNNNTAGVREREDANRTREAGSRDEVEGVVANTLNLYRDGAVGFIVWLDIVAGSPTPSGDKYSDSGSHQHSYRGGIEKENPYQHEIELIVVVDPNADAKVSDNRCCNQQQQQCPNRGEESAGKSEGPTPQNGHHKQLCHDEGYWWKEEE